MVILSVHQCSHRGVLYRLVQPSKRDRDCDSDQTECTCPPCVCSPLALLALTRVCFLILAGVLVFYPPPHPVEPRGRTTYVRTTLLSTRLSHGIHASDCTSRLVDKHLNIIVWPLQRHAPGFPTNLYLRFSHDFDKLQSITPRYITLAFAFTFDRDEIRLKTLNWVNFIILITRTVVREIDSCRFLALRKIIREIERERIALDIKVDLVCSYSRVLSVRWTNCFSSTTPKALEDHLTIDLTYRQVATTVSSALFSPPFCLIALWLSDICRLNCFLFISQYLENLNKKLTVRVYFDFTELRWRLYDQSQ